MVHEKRASAKLAAPDCASMGIAALNLGGPT